MRNKCKVSLFEQIRQFISKTTIINGERLVAAYPQDWINDSFIIPDNITTICDNSFVHFPDLKRINLPSCINAIGDNAFSNCRKLKAILLPESLREIGNNAFGPELETIVFSSIDVNFNQNIFNNCNSLKLIVVPNNQSNYFNKKLNLSNNSAKIIEYNDFIKSLKDEEIDIAIIDGKHGYRTYSGIKLTECIYKYGDFFSQGLASVTEDGEKYGYISPKGEFVLPPIYDSAGPFYGGIALVYIDDEYRWIDHEGNFIENPQILPLKEEDKENGIKTAPYHKYKNFLLKYNVLKKFKVPMGLNDSKQSKEGWRLSCKESITSDDTTIKCPLHKLGDGFESIDSILHRNWEIDLWIVTYPEKRFKVFNSLEKLATFLVENPQNEDVYYTDYWKEENKIFAKWHKEIKRKVKEFLDENRKVLLKLGATNVSSWDQYIEIFKEQFFSLDKECFIIDPSSGKVETHIKFIYNGEPVLLLDFNQDIKKWLVSRVEELLD